MAASRINLDTHTVELVGTAADSCRSARRARRRPDQARQSVAGRAHERAHPLAPGRGRSGGQETLGREAAENPAGTIVGSDDRFQLVLAAP